MEKKGFWNFLKEVHIQNILAIIILIVCSGIAFYALTHSIPGRSEVLLNKFYDMGLLAVLGWAFTREKKANIPVEPGTTTTQTTQTTTEVKDNENG